MDGLNSNLNLNGGVSPSVIPGLGEWAPADVPSTRSKKRMRWLMVLFSVLALTAVSLFVTLIYRMMQGY